MGADHRLPPPPRGGCLDPPGACCQAGMGLTGQGARSGPGIAANGSGSAGEINPAAWASSTPWAAVRSMESNARPMQSGQ